MIIGFNELDLFFNNFSKFGYKFKILYRPHKSTIFESLEHLKEFYSFVDFSNYLVNSYDDMMNFSSEDIVIHYYMYDERISWQTFIVCTYRFGELEFSSPRPLGFMTFFIEEAKK